MKMKTCCFIGHRSLTANVIEPIIKRLDYEIENLINQGVTNFVSGGIIGFDLSSPNFLFQEYNKTLEILGYISTISLCIA